MRFLVSFIFACAVWLTSAEALADVEAVGTADSFFTCVNGSIGFSAEDSTPEGELDYVWWDWNNDSTWDDYGPWDDYKSISHQWTSGGVYYVTVKVRDNDTGEWDTDTGGPFYVADPAIVADPTSGRRPLEVDFHTTDSLPGSISRSYAWDFIWDDEEIPDPDSYEATPTYEYDEPPGTYHCLVMVTYGGNSEWVCMDTVDITITGN